MESSGISECLKEVLVSSKRPLEKVESKKLMCGKVKKSRGSAVEFILWHAGESG